jgi:hypothetical protein
MDQFVLSLEKKGMVEDVGNIRWLLRDVVVEAVQGVCLVDAAGCGCCAEGIV